jgi:two-component system, OmpR family, phosphate regulon response regulator PhoB
VEPTILICDDEPSIRELMRISLEGDYAFAEAANVTEAMQLVDRSRPDLVLLDMMMPGGSGLDVLERVRNDAELSETRVVVISAFAAESDRLAAYEAGADGFLSKPFDPDELASLVQQLLGAR